MLGAWFILVVTWSFSVTMTLSGDITLPLSEICHRSDPKLNDCLMRIIYSVKDQLPNGIGELFIPPLDPLIIPEIKFEQNSPTIFIHSAYNDIEIHGLSDYTLNAFNMDPKKFELEATFNVPTITMKAKYSINGRIMMLPLSGNGNMQANLTDVNATVILNCSSFRKNNETFLKVHDVKVSYEVGGTKLHLDNLFGGDKKLSEGMNTFLNENWKLLSDEIRPMLKESIAGVVRSSLDRLLETYSLDQLLPE